MTNTFDKNNVNKNIVNKNIVNKNIVNKNIVLCGVGGQGTVLASKLIAAAAMEKGLRVMSAEPREAAMSSAISGSVIPCTRPCCGAGRRM